MSAANISVHTMDMEYDGHGIWWTANSEQSERANEVRSALARSNNNNTSMCERSDTTCEYVDNITRAKLNQTGVKNIAL